MKYKNITIKKDRRCKSLWYARFRANGRQYYVSANTQAKCLLLLKSKLNQVKDDNYVDTGLTLAEWYDKWFTVYKQGRVKDSTIKEYRLSKRYFEDLLKFKIRDIRPMHIVTALETVPRERQKQKVYELLNDIFDKAQKNQVVPHNPLNLVQKPRHTRVNGLALSPDDQIKLENATAPQFSIFKLAMFQGLRRGEVLALTGQDIDLEAKTITINKSINDKNEVDTTKNKASVRTVPLFEKSINLLKTIELINGRIFNYSPKTAQKLFDKLKEEMGWKDRYTIHSLRHTFITSCQEKKVPLHIIQSWVGHVSGSLVTSQVYTHVRPAADKKFVDLMNE